jgi:hypothetical protein
MTQGLYNHIPYAFVRAGNLATCQKVGICHIVSESFQQVDIILQETKRKIHSTKKSGNKHIKALDNKRHWPIWGKPVDSNGDSKRSGWLQFFLS